MKKIFFAFTTAIIAATVSAQPTGIQKLVVAGTFHKTGRTINGLSYGLWSGDGDKTTITNGARIEMPGIGIFAMVWPESLVAETDSAYENVMHMPVSEKINGLNISATGTACNCTVSGISFGSFGQYLMKMNGLSLSGLNMVQHGNGVQLAMYANDNYKMNGIQLAFFNNYSTRMRGLQVAAINHSKNSRGIQIGLWNVNEKRKLPFINWNFKS